MKIIEHSCTNPYENLAVDEYYFKKAGSDFFRLWQNRNTIVIGKNQNLYNEINLDVLREYDVTAVRRITGGGAVYHDLGNVNFSFMTDESGKKFDFERFNEPVIRALRSFGIEAAGQSRNDITIAGKKISGSAQCLSNGRILHHGTLLVDSDLEFIGKCLTASSEKLGFNGVASVRSRVANINDFLKERVSVAAFTERLLEFFVKEFEDCEFIGLSAEDAEAVNELRKNKHETREWVYGSQVKYNYSAAQRFEGCGGIDIYFEVVEDTVVGCRIFGDFFGTGDTADIESLIIGCKYDFDSIYNALKGMNIGHYFRNLKDSDFFDWIALFLKNS